VDTTISFYDEGPRARQPVNTGVDLILYDAWGRPETYPIDYDRFMIGTPSDTFQPDIPLRDRQDPAVRVLLNWSGGALFLSNESRVLRVSVNQQATTQRELFDGDCITIGNTHLRVVGLRSPVATLEGYTHPHSGQRWLLDVGRNAIGRKGQRINQVELEDGTVSRSHATLVVTDYGVSLEAETTSSQSKVNGHPVEPGHPQELQDGDLIQLGRQVFRLRLLGRRSAVRGSGEQAAVLCVRLHCVAPMAERPALYLGAYATLWQQPCEGLELLPHDGETLVYAAFGQAAAVDRLVEFARRLSRVWPHERVTMSMGLHAATADVQPPSADYASVRRSLAVAERLSALARRDGPHLVVSRAAWEASQLVTTTRRIGSLSVRGESTPIEAYYVDTM
jgi:hypothetical protein